jgi:hypothetical protein
MSKDQATMKRQATAAELSGQRGVDGFIPASFKTGNSLDRKIEERMTRRSGYMAPEIGGITHIEYPSAGQEPPSISFRVWEND